MPGVGTKLDITTNNVDSVSQAAENRHRHKMERLEHAALAYRLRWKRRRYLYRALRKRRQLKSVIDRTAQIRPDDMLVFSTVRNEALRLPFFLEHHRKLGVGHFLIVENGSDDGTRDYLAQQPDVSLWSSAHSYKLSRFGVDWLTWLQIKYAHGHWCLTLDADEVFIYPHHDTRPMRALVDWLDQNGRRSFGALMVDMYPKGPLTNHPYVPGEDPFRTLCWFDSGNYMIQKQPALANLWIQGGARARRFFADRPRRAPTMNKTPLVKWHRRYVYINSTHALLPRSLNVVYDEAGGERTSGVLLHTKFLPDAVAKAAEEKQRRQHFANSSLYQDYYDDLSANPDMWCKTSTKFINWRQLEAIGLMSKGNWI